MAHDLIVIGSGPSGSRTARLCAERGMEVLMLERDRHPRPKCCAGGVLERAIGYLGGLPDSLIERELDSFTVFREGESESCRLSRRVGVTVKRDRLDAHLVQEAERAGVELIEGSGVISVSERTDQVEVTTRSDVHWARYLVIAEGSQGRLATDLLGPLPIGSMSIGCAQLCESVGTPDRTLRIHLFPGERGRSGMSGASFPLRKGFSVSVVGHHTHRTDLLSGLDSMLARIRDRFDIRERGKPCFHPLPTRSRPRLCTRLSLAVGDAAGLVSPFSGEGLSYALRSAELASATLARAIEGVGKLTEYHGLCLKEIGQHMAAARLLGPILRRVTDLTDMSRLVGSFSTDEDLVEAVTRAAEGDGDWRDVLLALIPRAPVLLLSSLRD